MNITTTEIRDFFNSYSHHVTHVAVAHTNFHTFNCSDKEIALMALQAKKQCRYFRNCFNQFLYQAKAHRKPDLYQPLMLTTIEGTKDIANKANTIHFHFALGNIPACLSTEELEQIFEYCWVDKAKIGSQKIWLEPVRKNEEGAWLTYITKELNRGNIDVWDFENSQIPHAALQNK